MKTQCATPQFKSRVSSMSLALAAILVMPLSWGSGRLHLNENESIRYVVERLDIDTLREGSDTGAFAPKTFERLKMLEGKWLGVSTKGWQETMTFKTIAQGSVVCETSFEAHPNETMVTMYYLDLDRLLLTHYCVSKTQPRLQASSFEEEGRKVTFTFLDATNLPSRDKGHMDKVVFHFIDEDHFTSRWTWYQNGKEQWLEEIRYERLQ